MLASVIYRSRLVTLKLPKGQSTYRKRLVRGDKHGDHMYREKNRIVDVAEEPYMVAAVAGEGEEVDLPAVVDAAVLPQIRELGRAHPAGKGIFTPVERLEPPPPPPRDVTGLGEHREGGPEEDGEGNRSRELARSSNVRGTGSNKCGENFLSDTTGSFFNSFFFNFPINNQTSLLAIVIFFLCPGFT
jgi:hypothetical protein